MAMEISKIERFDYSFMIRANGGEEHLSIISTSGQSGHIALRVLATSVDGGHHDAPGVQELLHVPFGELRWEDSWKVLEPVLLKWGCPKDRIKWVKQQWERYQYL